jgi:RNA polymerase sigma factor (sigma-70 family)
MTAAIALLSSRSLDGGHERLHGSRPGPRIGPTSRAGGYHRTVSAEPTMTAESLEAAFAAGRADLRAVYDAHGPLVFSLCRRALGGHAANDVTQEVFVSAWRARDRFDPQRGNLAQWLVGITKRRIIDHLRSEGRHSDRRADDDHIQNRAHSEPQVDRLADRMLVADVLTHLPERARTVIHMAYFEDLTHQQIAERTGLPLGTVKSDIRRGLQRIREQLEVGDD